MPATDTQESHASIFFLAAFFLLVPVILLIWLATRSRPNPEGAFIRAVHKSSQPGDADVSHSLLQATFGKEITVVTWAKRDGVKDYRGKIETPAFKDTWVTIAPQVKKFCQDFVRDHGSDKTQLTRRLEQRLGLPRDSGYETFVEFSITPTDASQFFRPCIDPSPTSNSCQPAFTPACTNWSNRPENCLPRTAQELQADLDVSGQPAQPQAAGKTASIRHRFWFLNTYYNRFALPKGYPPFPWTSLGYTFDWDTEPGSDDFVEFGESEFVVPPKVPMKFIAAVDTATYCAP